MDETDLRLTDCNRMLSYRKRTALSMLKDSFSATKAILSERRRYRLRTVSKQVRNVTDCNCRARYRGPETGKIPL